MTASSATNELQEILDYVKSLEQEHSAERLQKWIENSNRDPEETQPK